MIMRHTILEHYINLSPDDLEGKRKYLKDVEDIINSSYKNIGGPINITSFEELLEPKYFWKLNRKDGKVNAVCIYKMSNGGRKISLCGCDSTQEGKQSLYALLGEDVTQEARQTWGEFSGALEHIYKDKLGATIIPNYVAKEILNRLGKDVKELNGDGIHYTRTIGGKDVEKVMLGNVPKEDSLGNMFKQEGLQEKMLVEAKEDKIKFTNWLKQEYEDNLANNLVDNFIKLKNGIKSPYNDFYYWMKNESQKAFSDYMDELMSKYAKKQQTKQSEKDGARLVYSDENWKVYEITTYEASAKYGKGTKWCISGSKRWSNGEHGSEYFDNYYNQKGVRFYYFINKDGNKWALAVYPNDSMCEIFNEEDVKVAFIPNAPVIDEIKVKYNDNSDWNILVNAIMSRQIEEQTILQLMEEVIYDNAIPYIEIFNNPNDFVSFLDENIPDGYLEHEAVANGDMSEDEYESLTGEEYDDDWGEDIPRIGLNDESDSLQYNSKKDLLNPDNFKDAKYWVCYDDGSGSGTEVYKAKDWVDLYQITNDLCVEDWDDDFGSVLANKLIDDIKERRVSKSALGNLGLSKEFLNGLGESLIKEDMYSDIENDLGSSDEPFKGPSYILPNGRFLKIRGGKQVISTKYGDREMTIHNDVQRYMQGRGYSKTNQGDYIDSIDLEERAIRVNTDYLEHYIVLPKERPNEAQFKSLIKWIDFFWGVSIQDLVLVSYYGPSETYFHGSVAEDIVDDIKDYYGRGMFFEGLSKGQEDFFKDSVIRDKDGNLLIMWHGTNVQFEEFGRPINWFSASKEYARQYAEWLGGKPRYYEAYLNCKKPLYCGSTDEPIYNLLPIKPYKFSNASLKLMKKLGLSEEQFRNLVELENEQAPDERDLDGYKKRLHVITRMPEFAEMVASLGYDSIVAIEDGNLCVGVFNPSDIKRVTNTAPTSSKNIDEGCKEAQRHGHFVDGLDEYFDNVEYTPDDGYSREEFPVYATDEAYRIKNMLQKGDKAYRIYYDESVGRFYMQDAFGNKTHYDMLELANANGWIDEKSSLYDYLDTDLDGYMVFMPFNYDKQLKWHTSLGEDEYYDCRVYPFGVMFVRDSRAYGNPLFKALGKPEREIHLDEDDGAITLNKDNATYDIDLYSLDYEPNNAITLDTSTLVRRKTQDELGNNSFAEVMKMLNRQGYEIITTKEDMPYYSIKFDCRGVRYLLIRYLLNSYNGDAWDLYNHDKPGLLIYSDLDFNKNEDINKIANLGMDDTETESLQESKQDIEKFRQWAGDELANRFFSVKQRLEGKYKDIYHYIGLEKDTFERMIKHSRWKDNQEQAKEYAHKVAIEELTNAIEYLERTPTRKEVDTKGKEGAEKVYEDGRWLVMKINTYEASVKYGKHTQWCITGTNSQEDGGRADWENHTEDGEQFYFYIDKQKDHKYALEFKDMHNWAFYVEDDYVDVGEGELFNNAVISLGCCWFPNEHSSYPAIPHVKGLPDIQQAYRDAIEDHNKEYPEDNLNVDDFRLESLREDANKYHREADADDSISYMGDDGQITLSKRDLGMDESVEDTFKFPNTPTMQRALKSLEQSGYKLEAVPLYTLVRDNGLLNNNGLNYHTSLWGPDPDDYRLDKDEINGWLFSDAMSCTHKNGKYLLDNGKHRARALYNSGYKSIEIPVLRESLDADSVAGKYTSSIKPHRGFILKDGSFVDLENSAHNAFIGNMAVELGLDIDPDDDDAYDDFEDSLGWVRVTSDGDGLVECFDNPTESQYSSLLKWLDLWMSFNDGVEVACPTSSGWKIVYYSFDETPPEDIVKRIRACFAGGTLREDSNKGTNISEKIVKKGSKWQVQSEKGKNLGTYDTKKEAEKRLKQVHYFKHVKEEVEDKDVYYRGYDSRYGVFDSDNEYGQLYTWVTDEPEYALEYAKNNEYGKVAKVRITCSDDEIGGALDLPEDVDYYDPGDEEFQECVLDQGLKGYGFDAGEYDDFFCICISKDCVEVIDPDVEVEVEDESLKEGKEDSQETDNKGNALSKEQVEFFKNSKVRDESGKLLVCYHGTDKGGFTSFNRSSGQEGRYGSYGIFFTSSRDVARTYTNTSHDLDDVLDTVVYDNASGSKTTQTKNSIYACYLNITNPLIVDCKGRKAFDCVVDVNGDIYHHIDDICAYADENGYDGVIAKNIVDDMLYGKDTNRLSGTDYIVFNSNQIKSISNKNPTNSGNINESLNEDKEDYQKKFDERTHAHIDRVNKYAKKIGKAYPHHDEDKFNELYDGYSLMSKNKEDITKEEQAMIDDATFKHVINNEHHCEHWVDPKDIEGFSRDNPTPHGCLDCSKMPESALEEMCCDWCAMSEEFNNTPFEWYEKNKDTRWHFNEEQDKFILDTLHKLWDESLNESKEQRKFFYKCSVNGEYFVSCNPNKIKEKNPKQVWILEWKNNKFMDMPGGKSAYINNAQGDLEAMNEYISLFPTMHVLESLNESTGFPITVYTYQKPQVRELLENGKTYIASYERANYNHYKDLSNLLGLSNCPIFGALSKEDLYSMLNSSGIDFEEENILHLEIPKENLHYMEYYDWTDYMYALDDAESFEEETGLSLQDLENLIKTQKSSIDYDECQVVFDRIEPQWYEDGKEEEKALNESKQDFEKFKAWCNNDELYNKFMQLRPRLSNIKFDNGAKGDDIYMWMKKTPKDLEYALNDIESTPTKREREKKAKEGAKLLYNKDCWKVYKIETYEASAKYGKNTTWCISGKNGYDGPDYYQGHEDITYFYIHGNEKFALIWEKGDNYWTIWNDLDEIVPYVPNAPKVEGLPDISQLPQELCQEIAKVLGINPSEIKDIWSASNNPELMELFFDYDTNKNYVVDTDTKMYFVIGRGSSYEDVTDEVMEYINSEY